MDNSQESSYESSSQNNEYQKQALLKLEQKRIKQQLKQIPFGDLIKLQQSQNNLKKQPIKKNPKALRKKLQKGAMNQNSDKNVAKQIKIMKMPPKKIIKPIFEQRRKKGVDPRFENYAGTYNADLATKSYSFIKQMQAQETVKLKKQIHNPKIKEDKREVLIRNYNKLTNDMKRNELSNLEKTIRSKYKKGNYMPKKRQLKQQIEKSKLQALTEKNQGKRLRQKTKKIEKQRMIEKKRSKQQALH